MSEPQLYSDSDYPEHIDARGCAAEVRRPPARQRPLLATARVFRAR